MEPTMAKGYWIAHVDVSDPEVYASYVAANAAPISEYGGRFLVRAGENEVPEGSLRSRHVVVEFDTYERAVECYHSAGYQAAKAIRESASAGDTVIIEGYDGPQPGD